MISTVTTAFLKHEGTLLPVIDNNCKTVHRWFISAPTIDDIRELLAAEKISQLGREILFITLQTS
jgi:hypothetical protein